MERRVRRAVPAPPEPPAWLVPVVVAFSLGVAVVVELLADRRSAADPDPARSEPDRPEAEPEGGHHPASEEDAEADAVAEALETLNVEHPPVPEKGEVRAEYRSLAVETHPDQGGDAERFIEVQEAWETVSEREELSGNPNDREVTQES